MNLSSGMSQGRVPELKPPPEVIPNFTNPENYQITIVFTLTLCLSLATIVTALRLYTKVFIIKSIALEDCEYRLGL